MRYSPLMRTRTQYGLLLISQLVLAAILGGGTSVFGKIALEEIPAFSFTFLRFALASLLLLPVKVKSPYGSLLATSVPLIVLSLLATANVVLFSFGIQYTTANINQIIYTSVPLWAAVLAYWLIGMVFNWRKKIGLIAGFGGTLLILLIPLLQSDLSGDASLFGNLLLALAAIMYALYNVLSKQYQRSYQPIQITQVFVYTTTLISAVLALYDLYLNPGWWGDVSAASWGALAYVSVFGTAIYYLMIQHLIRSTGPVMATTVLYVQAPATFVWSFFLLREPLTWMMLAGGVLIAAGVYLVSDRTRSSAELPRSP